MQYAYERSRELSNESFYALIMAAMRKADYTNQCKLKAAWPEVWSELQERYHAPGGIIETDQEIAEGTEFIIVLGNDPKG